MIKYILNFLATNKKNNIFTKQYTDNYNKLWIDSIKNYTP